MVDQIDMDRLAAQQGPAGPEGGGYSALPGMVRELIRTPGFKELLMLHLRDINPDNARELMKAAIWEDVVFTMSALGATPQLVNWLLEALIELGVQLNNFTLDILRDFLVKLGQDLDVEKLRLLPAAYAPLVNELLLEDREALDGLIAGLGSLAEDLAGAGERTWRKIWNTADFGKIRAGLSAHFDERRAQMQDDPDIFNPVALSNLLAAIPSLVNFVLRALTRTVQGMTLPAEILANAIFQLLEDLDMAEVGGLVNALSAFLNALHRGNLLLGRDEPRFREVLSRIIRNLVDGVDGEVFREMLLSLRDDGAVVGKVLSEYIYASPEATVEVGRWLCLATGAALRTTAETMRRVGELPEEAVGSFVDILAETVDPRELGRIVNYGAAQASKAMAARPGEMGRQVGRLLASLEGEELAEAGKAAFLEIRDAALADPALQAALEPERVGEMINTGLATFNRFAWRNPGLMADKAARTLAVVDMDQVVLAAGEVMGAGLKALVKNPAVIGKALKPLAKPAAIAAGAGAAALTGLAAMVLIVRRWRN